MEEAKDIQLYKEFLKGNKEAFNEIIEKYSKPITYFINKYVQDINIAEDLSQDVFLYILVNQKEYDFKYSLKTYLYTIAKCRAINHIKRSKKHLQLDEEYMQNQEDNFEMEEYLEKEENKAKLYKMIEKLKPEYKRVIYLKDIQEFTYKDICRILDKTMPQTKVLIHRARKSLNKIIKKEGYTC